MPAIEGLREFRAPEDYALLDELLAVVLPDYPNLAEHIRHDDETLKPPARMKRWLVEREGRDRLRVVVYYDRCASCGLCELSCPQGAIRLEPRFQPAAPCVEALRAEWRRDGAGSEPDDSAPS